MPNLIKVGLFHQLPISLHISLYNIMPQLLVTGPEDSKFNSYSKNLNPENCANIFDLGATGSTVQQYSSCRYPSKEACNFLGFKKLCKIPCFW